MSTDTLKGAWRDLLRNEIYLDKLIAVAHDGCGLYKVSKGRDDKYTVKLTDATQELRQNFLTDIANDAATGGTYQRRSSLHRLRLAGDSAADDVLVDEPDPDHDVLIDAATTRKVVAAVAYNVAAPGERSMDVIRRLEATRLYLSAKAIDEEHKRLIDWAEDSFVLACEKYNVDLTKSTAKIERTVIDAGTGKPRNGYWRSEWQRHLRDVLGRRPDPAKLHAVIALARKFDKLTGQARQLGAVVDQVHEIAKAGGLDEHGELEICTRYAKLSNRRFQALDFWMTKVSGKDEQNEVVDLGPADCPSGPDDVTGPPIEMTLTRSRRGRLFRIAASVSQDERQADLDFA